MSNLEDRKHLLLDSLNHQQLGNNQTYTVMGWGHSNSDDEVEERENDIPQRWKTPIEQSIINYRRFFSQKQELKARILENRNINGETISNLKLYELNRFDVFFYKIISPTIYENFKEILIGSLNLNSFYFIKLDYNNTCLSFTLNYNDSKKLIEIFESIIGMQNRDSIENDLHIFRLIKKFRLLTEDKKLRNNLYIENDDEYNIFIPPTNINLNNISSILSSFSLEYVDQTVKSEGWYLKVRGNERNLKEFLLFFDVSENVYSSTLLTRIYSNDESPAIINRELRLPTITTNTNLPIVFLLDSGLPLERDLLNPLLKDFVIEQKTLSNLSSITPVRDHATQMAGIIIYGDQLNKVNLENFVDSEITPYARVYSMIVGDDRPRIGIWSIPEILESLNQVQLDQNIRIFNMSFNLNDSKEDNINIHPFSFLIDKYLFFHPEILVLNSSGNCDDSQNGNYFTEQSCNLLIPSDAINILSVGSFYKDDSGYGIASGSTKNHYDKGIITNPIKSGTNKWVSIKRMENYYKKPDVLGMGENWESTTTDTSLSLLKQGNGTSHATAYISSIAAQLLGIYPNFRYAMSIENIILKFTRNLDIQHNIDFSCPLNEEIQNRIDELCNKTDLDAFEIKSREDEIMKKRFSGDRAVDISNIFYNTKNRKTFIIEGEINLGSIDSIRINLLDYISRTELESSTVSIDGFLSYRGLPNLFDSLGYNMINISSAIWFNSDFQDGDFINKNHIRWSSNQCCRSRVRYTRNNIEKITTRTNSFKNLLLQNDWNIDVILKAVIRRNRDNNIKKVIKEYFDDLGDNECVGWLNDAFQQYQENGDVEIQTIKIPYSVLISVDIQADVDIYDVVETSISQEISL